MDAGPGAPADRDDLPGGVVFREAQRVREPWAFAVVGAVALLFLGGLVGSIATGSFHPAVLVLAVPFGGLLPAMILSMELVTEVRVDGVYVRYAPFHRRFRRFAFADLAGAEVRRYAAVAEHGGWGLRLRAKGVAYTMSGDQGLDLALKDGRRVLVGTRRPRDLWAAFVSVAPPRA